MVLFYCFVWSTLFLFPARAVGRSAGCQTLVPLAFDQLLFIGQKSDLFSVLLVAKKQNWVLLHWIMYAIACNCISKIGIEFDSPDLHATLCYSMRSF